MIIAGIISFAGMIFPVYQHQPKEATDLLGYYLPWCLAYGIPCFAMAVYGVLGLTMLTNYDFFKNSAGIAGIISGSLLIIGSFPVVIFYQAWEFFFSILIIGGCVLAIGILEQSALNHHE